MTARDEFERLMRQLEDWYADSVRAVAPDADRGHAASPVGHRILHVNSYPGPNWREAWARLDPDDLAGEQAIIRALGEELYGLDHGPSQSGPASGLHRGTREWSLAVASADGSLRAVARRFGVSHSTVRRERLAHPEVRGLTT